MRTKSSRNPPGNLYNMFKKAESTLAFNNPVMMLVIYASIMAICWFGAKFIVVDKTLQIGELTSLFSYVMGSLMSLMMLSTIFVMITMSVASMRRITEVLREQPDLAEPFCSRRVNVKRQHRLRQCAFQIP